jgi:hypothetical protein
VEGSRHVSDLEREETVRSLRDELAAGRLTLEEFSERVDEAYGARTRGELQLVRRQLPELTAAAPPRRPARLAVALFGRFVRRGRLRLRRWLLAISVFGDLDLDLRQASVDHRRASVVVLALVGNADVYVPEGVDVDSRGVTLGGHVRDWGRDAPKEGSPHIRVRVFTLFGTADVWRVPPGARGGYRQLIDAIRRPALQPPQHDPG